MINWNERNQVENTLWGEHKELEDHIVPHPKNHDGDSLCNFERCSKKQRNKNDFNTSSTIETFGSKYDLMASKLKNSFDSSTDHLLNKANIDIDPWPDLPNLSMPFGLARDSVINGLVSDLADASDFKSVEGFLEEYNSSRGLLIGQNSSSLSKETAFLSNKEIQFDSDSNLFRQVDKENDKFLGYDWGNVEDFDDFDKMFRNNDSVFKNDVVDNAGTIFSTPDLISRTSQSIPVPDIPIFRYQALEEVSSSIQLSEHSDINANPLQKKEEKLHNKYDQASKSQDEKEKGQSSQSKNNSDYDLQVLKMSHPPEFQAPFMEQPSSHHAVPPNYGYPSYQFNSVPLSPQINAAKNHKKPILQASKPLIMTPREKIEKLRRRQQMQAMYAIQKQREQYNHPISGCDEAPSLSCLQNNENIARNSFFLEDCAKKLCSLEAKCDAEQPQMMSSLLEGCSVEEAIYYQLQEAMGKLDLKVRLSICNSLYRLARSAMERQNVNDRSSANESHKHAGEASADGKSYNHERFSKIEDSEAITNPMDRIVAHLLFHNTSGSSSLLPIADGDVSMAASI